MELNSTSGGGVLSLPPQVKRLNVLPVRCAPIDPVMFKKWVPALKNGGTFDLLLVAHSRGGGRVAPSRVLPLLLTWGRVAPRRARGGRDQEEAITSPAGIPSSSSRPPPGWESECIDRRGESGERRSGGSAEHLQRGRGGAPSMGVRGPVSTHLEAIPRGGLGLLAG